MIRSRLRKPTSKSMTATFLPRLASPTASEALVVVLPTPPLPEVTTMISVNGELLEFEVLQRWLLQLSAARFSRIGNPGSQLLQHQAIIFQPCLHRLPAQLGRDILDHA